MSLVDSQLTSIAFCWQLERRDGAGLALTSHDRPLIAKGVRYEPAPGITPAAIQAEMGLDPRASEVSGPLSSAAISEADLAAGRWNGAALRLTAVDWSAPEDDGHELLCGELGEVSNGNGVFEAELTGIATRLGRPICPLTSPECRAELGDPRCGVNLAGRRLRARVASAAGHVVTIDRPVEGRFRFGQLRILGGVANGERRTILSLSDGQISLRSTPSGEVSAGTPVELIEGCDKRLETCSGRFNNAANFRGEPHLPGNDLLTRYPGA